MKKKILLVDDEPDIRLLMTARLNYMGYDVVTAGDGQEGLNLARKESPDLILLDLMLPKLDGYKVCRMLKFDKAYGHIPVVIFSSRGSEEDKKLAAEVGADGYMIKPFQEQELVSTLQKFFGA
ncbi:MAG: response regulator [Candidatus Omnitrophica bacterium]|nr:response regulator [Candidatus Omnitrophota bacterium]